MAVADLSNTSSLRRQTNESPRWRTFALTLTGIRASADHDLSAWRFHYGRRTCATVIGRLHLPPSGTSTVLWDVQTVAIPALNQVQFGLEDQTDVRSSGCRVVRGVVLGLGIHTPAAKPGSSGGADAPGGAHAFNQPSAELSAALVTLAVVWEWRFLEWQAAPTGRRAASDAY